ncbi:hemagglutinin repeat-containing protein [Iodobacter sp. CM08]|uniref:hemagglutinin repeat-containing protein n=1 Tax=Iodobacter sp. CM08 TaxID=3085902 RepID=UPI0029819833|nr:hemagglutinin repeat-containing protein [Iodobacter sp. CM08]MDW5415711.1 hemagglutinin repeat-containing protein [Iodobacter sp. CM08]
MCCIASLGPIFSAADPKSLSVSITYGESKSESTTKSSSISHSGSTLNAKGNIKLKSDGDINLQSALDESEQHSKNSSSNWGAGVAITFGQGGASYDVTANGSLSRGHADGKDTAQQNSHINAAKTLELDSGNDTRIEGAVVSGNKIIADVGGDLKLASRQDTSQFDSKQSSVSASVTVGVGVSGSASISQDKMKSDYAAVQEQSGLFAGKDGFEIKVKNNTDLNGAVIASKSADNTLSTGTLTQKEINNHAEYSASSIGIGGGFSMGGTEKKPDDGKSGDQAAAPSGSKLYDAGPSGVTATMPVALSAGDNGTSTTKSAIATAKITITDEAKQKELTGKTAAETIASLNRDTDSAQQKLDNDFKPEKINELFSATKTFLQEGNTFMANRTAEADAAKKALAENTDPTATNALKDKLTEANKWTPGGDYGRAMTALQAAVGGNVSGGVTGLVQNASVAYVQSLGAEKIKEIANSFQKVDGEENQTSQNVRAALHAIASCAGAAVTASNCSSAAVGAASSVVINNVLSEIENTTADKMTASEKEKRKNLVGSIITGIVAATDGNAAAANNAAQIEMENNALTFLKGTTARVKTVATSTADFLAKPQGKVTRTEIDGELAKLKTLASKGDLSVQESLNLSSLWIAVVTRAESEKLMTSSEGVNSKEFMRAAIASMAFGGSNNSLKSPKSETGPELPSTTGTATKYNKSDGVADIGAASQLRQDLAKKEGIPRGVENIWGANKNDLKKAYKMDGYATLDEAPIKGTSGNAQVFKVDNHPLVSKVQFSPASEDSIHKGQYYKVTYKDGSIGKIIEPTTYKKYDPAENKGRVVYFNPDGQTIIPLDKYGKNWRVK